MKITHPVIIIPGLSDETRGLLSVTRHWRRYGLEPIVHAVGWHDGEDSFQRKLNKLVSLIDALSKRSDTVSIIGTSAGGSAALNAFCVRKEKVQSVISICARLRTGPLHGYRSFQSKTASSPAFAQSVKMFEQREKALRVSDRQKIMTVRALFGDELVPSETAIVDGAYNTTVPTPEHLFSIGMSLTFFSRPLLMFLSRTH